MFSAIFGNIFYGQAATATTETNTSNEVSTQTFDNKTIATQVNLDTSKHNNSNLNDTSTSQQLDWVIVDEESQNTNDKACSVNNVEMTEEVVPTSLPSMESDDVLIGSFFRKNEADEGEHAANSTDKTQTWLITPLPCLTSITASSQQKSMIDNDQIENLRIEQPARFMSASTIAATTPEAKPISRRQSMKGRPTLRYKKTYAEVTQQEDVVEIKSLFETVELSAAPSAPITTIVVFEPPSTPITRNEKRKEAEKSSSVSPSSSMESPKKISRKTGKSMKTGKNTSSSRPKANKENMQMKTLLMAECFPNEGKKNKNSGRYGQTLRANKNSALFGMAGNTRQRKFHNLQQPSITVPHVVKF